MMKLRKLNYSALILMVALVACQPVSAARVAQSSQLRNSQPTVGDAELGALVSGNNAFAFDLFNEIKTGSGNLFFSPYSISLALAMTYGGAQGDTEAQMARSMHYTLSQDQLHPAFNDLALELDQRASAPGVPADKAFHLSIANALWGQDGFPFQPVYLDLLAENYGAGMHLLDFSKDPDAARQAINDWVSQHTNQKITNIVPPGAIDPLTRLVLSNAIYFKADWASEFSKDSTSRSPFTLLDGSQVTIPIMYQHGTFRYDEGSGLQALELPYAGDQLSMLILLPKAGTFDEVQSSLTGAKLESIVAGLQSQDVDLWLPKFNFAYSLSLEPALVKLGMVAAFDDSTADFSGMDGRRDLYISDIFHKAFVAVDEAGTEAAATTVVVMSESALMPGSPVQFRVDRPFIFLIRDNPTGTILFLGRVLNPAQ